MKSIALIGLPGAGKSTLGKLLATALSWDFIDTDLALFHAQNNPSKIYDNLIQMYEHIPPEKYKIMEEKFLQKLIKKSKHVLAPGGGIVTSPLARQLLADNYQVLYLNPPLEVLADRIQGQPPRPMFQNLGITPTLIQLERERRALYQTLAHRVFDDLDPPETILEKIIGELGFKP